MQSETLPVVTNNEIAFEALFQALPGNYIIYKPDAPYFTILAASDLFLQTTGTRRSEIVGKSVFEVFPENPDVLDSNSRASLLASLEKVAKEKTPDELPVIRYDVLKESGVFEERYWSASSRPVFINNGEVAYIIHATKDITDKIKAESRASALQEIEKNFNLFMQAPVAISILKGIDYAVELANDEMLRFLGRDQHIIGKPIIQSLPEARVQGLTSILDTVRATGKPYAVSTFPAVILINGVREARYFDLIFKPYYNSDDETNVTSIFCVAHNVTEQVAARNLLKESEYRFRTVIEEASVATAIYIGPEIRIQYANEIMFQYWGKNSSVIGKTLREALPELEGQPFPRLLENVYATGQAYTGIHEKADLVINGQLQSFYFNFFYKPLHDSEGNIYGVHHMAIDVTDEVLAVQKLEEEKQRTALAVESAELGTYEVNLETGEISSTPRMEAIFGVDRSSDHKKYIATVYHEDLSVREAAHKLAYETGVLNYDGRVVWKDGSVHWIRVHGKVFYNDQAKPIRLLGVVQDITEQKKFEDELNRQVKERTFDLENKNKELERSNANLEEFAYAASHDLKEPVRKIHFFSDRLKSLLADKLEKEDEYYFERMETAARRMSVLIDDLLMYSHISRGAIIEEKVDLNYLVKTVLEDLELEIEQQNAVINITGLPAVMGHKRQLQQLFQNLVSNSIKYSRPDVSPVINIRGSLLSGKETGLALSSDEVKKQFVFIEVSDNGIGFDQEDAERIFNVFTRLHGNSEYRGTGVGLSIVRKVVENHHGQIVAEGKPEEGATFKIYLPVQENS